MPYTIYLIATDGDYLLLQALSAVSILNATLSNPLIKINSVAQGDFHMYISAFKKMSGMQKDGSEISELFLRFQHTDRKGDGKFPPI